MSPFPRREIEEIIEIVVREPKLQSVFVEGKFDKDVLEKYLRTVGLDKVANVYSIDSICVPDELIKAYGLNSKSNKARVIALANQISKACSPTDAPRALCVADADCDRELGAMLSVTALSYTDHTCMEMYGFDIAALTETFKFSLGLLENDVRVFLDFMNEVLPTLFALRCCNEQLHLNATMPDLRSGFGKKKARKGTKFDAPKYVDLFIMQNGLNSRRAEIKALYSSRMSNLGKDIRDKAHGHDAVRLFYLYTQRTNTLNISDAEIDDVGNRLFLSALNFETLEKSNLFSKVSGNARPFLK